jgi:MFS family permease
MEDLGTPEVWTGYIRAARQAGQAVAMMWSGTVSDHLGRKPVLAATLLGVATGMIGSGLARSWQSLMLWQGLVGVFASGFQVGIAYLTDFLPPNERNTSMARLGAACGAFGILAPPLGSLLYMIHRRLAFLLSGAIDILVFLLLWRHLPLRDELEAELMDEIMDSTSASQNKGGANGDAGAAIVDAAKRRSVSYTMPTELKEPPASSDEEGSRDDDDRCQLRRAKAHRRRASSEYARRVAGAGPDKDSLRRERSSNPEDLLRTQRQSTRSVLNDVTGLRTGPLRDDDLVSIVLLCCAGCVIATSAQAGSAVSPLWLQDFLGWSTPEVTVLGVAGGIYGCTLSWVMVPMAQRRFGLLPCGIGAGLLWALGTALWSFVRSVNVMPMVCLVLSTLIATIGSCLNGVVNPLLAERSTSNRVGTVLSMGAVTAALGNCIGSVLLSTLYGVNPELVPLTSGFLQLAGAGFYASVLWRERSRERRDETLLAATPALGDPLLGGAQALDEHKEDESSEICESLLI